MKQRMAAIGTFDGVHLGHQSLLTRLDVTAAVENYTPMIVTFDRHPLELIAPDRAPKLLMSPIERFNELRHYQSILAIIKFDDKTRRMTAREFMAMLRDRYHVGAIFMGFNHHFGSDRLKSIDDYRAAADELGLKIFKGVESEVGGHKVSSSIVRRQLEEGDVAAAMKSLGRPYRLMGMVGEGKQLGRTLEFPTANLRPVEPRQLIPASGVYACTVTLADGHGYKAMVNIGVRPTVESHGRPTIEAHIFDFVGDLYGRPITLQFVARMRAERRFASLDDLRMQLLKDAGEARAILDQRIKGIYMP